MGNTSFSMEKKALACASVSVPTHSYRQGEREGPIATGKEKEKDHLDTGDSLSVARA